jgi:hypothetical protein
VLGTSSNPRLEYYKQFEDLVADAHLDNSDHSLLKSVYFTGISGILDSRGLKNISTMDIKSDEMIRLVVLDMVCSVHDVKYLTPPNTLMNKYLLGYQAPKKSDEISYSRLSSGQAKMVQDLLQRIISNTSAQSIAHLRAQEILNWIESQLRTELTR